VVPYQQCESAPPGLRVENERNIYLIGFMGAGKSTLGPLLAARWGWRFVDSDGDVEALCGQTVEHVFRTEGESAFRAHESRVLKRLSAQRRCVVAVGGGAPTQARNWPALRTGLTVYLCLSAAALVERLAGVRRPLLGDLSPADKAKKVHDMLRQRETYYRQATLIVSAAGVPADVVEAIARDVKTCRS